MQRHGALRRPLRSIIKSIGVKDDDHHPTALRRGHSIPSTNRPHSTQSSHLQSSRQPLELEIEQHDGDSRDRCRSQSRGLSLRSHRCYNTFPPLQASRICDASDDLHRRSAATKSRQYSRARIAIEAARGAGEDTGSTSGTTRKSQGQQAKRNRARNDGPVILRRVLAHSPPEDYNSSFEDVVKDAEKRPSDGEPRVKSGDKLKVHYFNAYHSSREHRLRKAFRRWQILKERHQDPSSDDWRRVLSLLEDATPNGEEHFKRKMQAVDIPGDVSLAFKHQAGDSILEIMQRTGSHVQVGSRVPGTHASLRETQGTFCNLSLLGTPQENAAALKILPQYINVFPMKDTKASKDLSDYTLRSPDKSCWDEQDTLSEADIERLENYLDQVTGSTDRVTVPIRAVWASDRLERRSSLQIKNLLRRPKTLSTADLTSYVEDLTQKLPRLVIVKLYGKQLPKSHGGHVNVVSKELVSLFTDEAVVKNAAAATLDRALQFLTKHSKFDAFRKIFTSLEHQGFEFAVSNWNVLLAAAAKSGDVFNFRYILKLMLDRKAPPTPRTWALFHDLMSRRFPLEAGVAVEAMRKKGLLVDNAAASLIAANSAGNELTAQLAMKGKLDVQEKLRSFYKLYDNRFGLSYGRSDYEWLNINVVNRMCNVLLAAGRVEDAFAVLAEFRARNEGKSRRNSVETATLDIFLTSALRDGDASSAIAILQYFRVSQPGAVVPGHVTYSILFTLAWRQKYYNMLRVVWRYACAAGHVGYSMQARMRASIIWQQSKRAAVDEATTRNQLWMQWAAKFAAGVHDGLRDLRDLPTFSPSDGPDGTRRQSMSAVGLSAFGTSQVRLAATSRLWDGTQQHGDLQREAEKIVHTDLVQVQHLAPVLSFADLLEEAFKKDREWKEELLGHTQGLQFADEEGDAFEVMMQRGIRVPVRVGDYTNGVRKWEAPGVLYNKRINERA